MSTAYHKNLAKLKKVMPYGYQTMIAEKLANIDKRDVQRAFSGKLANTYKLRKISQMATRIAEKETQNVRVLNNRVKRVAVKNMGAVRKKI